MDGKPTMSEFPGQSRGPKAAAGPLFTGEHQRLRSTNKSLVAIWRIPAAEALMAEGTMDKAKGGRTSAPPFAP